MICIAIIANPDKLSGKLTTIFAGSPAYHIGFVDTERNKFYDMNLLFRRRNWPHYSAEHVKLYKCPVPVTAEQLEHRLDTDKDVYNIIAYTIFAIKRLWVKVLRLERPSFKADICSSKVEEILVEDAGWISPFKDFVPSPTDFETILEPL